MKRICVGYLPYQWLALPQSAQKMNQLPKNAPNEKWKPKFLRNSQKLKSFYDFFSINMNINVNININSKDEIFHIATKIGQILQVTV